MAEVWDTPAFDDIATSETVTAAYLNQLGNSLRFLERVHYSEFTSDVSVTATSMATANTVLAGSAVTYDSTSDYHIEVFIPFGTHSSAGVNIRVVLFAGTTSLGDLTEFNGTQRQAIGKLGRTFAAGVLSGSLTINVKAWAGSATGTLFAGAGGTPSAGAASDVNVPGYLSITRIPV